MTKIEIDYLITGIHALAMGGRDAAIELQKAVSNDEAVMCDIEEAQLWLLNIINEEEI